MVFGEFKFLFFFNNTFNDIKQTIIDKNLGNNESMFDNTIAEDKSYAEGTMNKHGYTVIQEVMQGCKEKNLKKIF